jgi:hypothetical protein
MPENRDDVERISSLHIVPILSIMNGISYQKIVFLSMISTQ